ncbi:hypothetical protein DENSPDRAFT_520902 [Dentipellis sp. KUC8613]|nr:hypothetical protein DENSPDRAFT_520902 [Dentipellis sp. KUC8613]
MYWYNNVLFAFPRLHKYVNSTLYPVARVSSRSALVCYLRVRSCRTASSPASYLQTGLAQNNRKQPPFLMSQLIRIQPLNILGYEYRRIIVGLISVVTLFLVRYFNSPYRKLPPGPAPLPILGNLLSLVGRSRLSVITEWKETYGNLIYLSVPGQRMLVINSHKVAMDLLEHRSSK